MTTSLSSFDHSEIRVTSESGGQKGAKLARFDQIPTYPLRLLAEQYGKGNAKYGEANGMDNWRNGYDWSLSYAALQRHVNAFWAGEDIDAETGTPHLICVAWHCFALTEWSRHPELVEQFDDRQDTLLAERRESKRIDDLCAVLSLNEHTMPIEEIEAWLANLVPPCQNESKAGTKPRPSYVRQWFGAGRVPLQEPIL